MKAFVFGSIIVVVSCQLFNKELNKEWRDFVVDQKKVYLSLPEELKRRMIFDSNMEKIAKHNKEYEKGLHSYSLASNQFADMSGEEFISRYSNDFFPSKTEGNHYKPKRKTLPDTWDWRDKNVVTPIKDQRHCESCWAFVAIGSLESVHAIVNKELVTLSEQNVVDCTRSFSVMEVNELCERNVGPGKCSPYEINYAFDYIIENGGVNTEESYPYVGYGQPCAFKPESIGARMTHYLNISDENSIKEAVATDGPVAVGVYTDIDYSDNSAVYKIQFYSNGIIDDNCLVSYGGHAVVLIGYGTEDGKDYWLGKNRFHRYIQRRIQPIYCFQNMVPLCYLAIVFSLFLAILPNSPENIPTTCYPVSWGTSWGDKGYCKIIRNVNHCDITRTAMIAMVSG